MMENKAKIVEKHKKDDIKKEVKSMTKVDKSELSEEECNVLAKKSLEKLIKAVDGYEQVIERVESSDYDSEGNLIKTNVKTKTALVTLDGKDLLKVLQSLDDNFKPGYAKDAEVDAARALLTYQIKE